MGWRSILVIFFLIFMVATLWISYFAGYGDLDLSIQERDPSFNLGVENQEMQFYQNLRYPTTQITYNIDDACTLQKKDDLLRAFESLENVTELEFLEVSRNEGIYINCQSQAKMNGDLFVAGEGGPVNITKSGEFNVITYGEILLIKESECFNPNVAIHELLHVLGFEHSLNENNIMYNISKCYQTIGPEIPSLINELYSIESLPDLMIDEISPSVRGKYLNVNLSLKNEGLQASKASNVSIYTDRNLVETIEVEPLDIGYGVKFMLENVKIQKTSFNELKFIIDLDQNELDKQNNEVIFSVN